MMLSGVRRGNGWPREWSHGTRNGSRNILFSQPWVSKLSWQMRPAFLRQPQKSAKKLFAGPWVGEFGWELMSWQGLIRALRPYYEHITVCARSSSAALYADCSDAFVPHQIQGQSNAHVVFDVSNPAELKRALDWVPHDADHLIPLRYVPLAAQSFVRFGCAEKAMDRMDVLLHARGNAYSADRNWSKDKWCTLVEKLQQARLRVGTIGLRGATLDLQGVVDCRDCPLESTMDLIASAKVVVGPSSGPMHLSALCGTPHLVWTDRRTYSMRRTSRQLYESDWNPHGTAVLVLDECAFDPSVDEAWSGIQQLLAGD